MYVLAFVVLGLLGVTWLVTQTYLHAKELEAQRPIIPSPEAAALHSAQAVQALRAEVAELRRRVQTLEAIVVEADNNDLRSTSANAGPPPVRDGGSPS